MSFRIASVLRNLSEQVPEIAGPTAPAVSMSNTADSATTVNLSNEGTIDWWWFGSQTASNVPFDLTYLNLHMKRFGRSCLRDGFRWRFGGGTVTTLTQTSGRTMQSNAGDNQQSTTTINNTNKTGYQTTVTGLGGFGFTMSLPISEVTRRLKAYVISFACDIQIDALVLGNDGQTATATDTITSAAATVKNSIIQVDYSGPAKGGRLILNVFVTTQHQATPNFQVQSFTLQEP